MPGTPECGVCYWCARGRPDQAGAERAEALERLELVAADLSDPLLAQSLRASPPFERARRGGR